MWGMWCSCVGGVGGISGVGGIGGVCGVCDVGCVGGGNVDFTYLFLVYALFHQKDLLYKIYTTKNVILCIDNEFFTKDTYVVVAFHWHSL